MIRRSVPLGLALLSASNPKLQVIDILSKFSHDHDAEVAHNAIFAMGIIGAGIFLDVHVTPSSHFLEILLHSSPLANIILLHIVGSLKSGHGVKRTTPREFFSLKMLSINLKRQFQWCSL